MHGLMRRISAAGVAAILAVFLVAPVAANAATVKTSDSTVTNHIARALAKAPRGITHWTIVVRQMRVSALTGLAGKESAGILTNTVYGDCGSSWMAIGDQGGGNAWIALGWDIYYSAYSEYWSTAVSPFGSNAGSGAVAPWSSTSWDTGYSSWEGHWVWVFGSAYMVANLYPWYGFGPCVSQGPTAWALIT